MDSCFHSVGLPSEPILWVFQSVADTGYAAIELNAETLPWAGPHVSPETPAALRHEIVAAAAQHRLRIPAIGAHTEMVGEDAKARAQAIGFVKGCIDLAVDLGAPVVHILSGPLPRAVSEDQAQAWFNDAVAETVDHAAARNVLLGIEAIAGHFFHGVDDYHRLARDLPGVDFRVNFDPSHLVVQGEDCLRVIDELGDRIVHVHAKDGKGRFPDFSFPPLGQGVIDFGRLIEGLRGIGYPGAVSVEYEAQVYGYRQTDWEILNEGLAFLVDRGVGGRA